MNRGILRSLLMAGVVVGALAAAGNAQAGFGHWGYPYVGWTGYSYSYYGGWGGYGGCCAPTYTACYAPSYGCCDPCYTPAYRGCGLLGRWGYRWRAHHYGYYGGCCDPCYRPTCCSVCGVADCCCGGSEGVIEYGSPSVEPGPTPAEPPADPGALPEKQTSLTGDSAWLSVDVPANARVLVNGLTTRSTGESRRYVSRNLVPGFDYTYEVTAEVMVDGAPVTQTKTVQLQAGKEAKLAFQMDAPAPVETALTLHVPADAKVYLAGNQTQGTGEVRTFRTKKLSEGQSWSDYIVRVVIDQDGLTRSLEEKVTLQAGDQRELSFDFDIDKVASVR